MTSAPSSCFLSVKPSDVRHIDLTRSLPTLHGSLTPEAIEDAEAFINPAGWIFAAFLLIHAGLLLACWSLS